MTRNSYTVKWNVAGKIHSASFYADGDDKRKDAEDYVRYLATLSTVSDALIYYVTATGKVGLSGGVSIFNYKLRG